MCSNETPTTSTPRLPMPFNLDNGPRALLPIDQYRLQLYQYAVAERLRYPLLNPFPTPLPCYPLFPRVLQPEEPKPQHSYIGLIAMAILSAPEGKLVLSDIYQHILDHYPYFRTRGPGWRNSIRHNLSLNDCFIKAGRSANGKGHYWAIHPANVDDFRKGDFRRRKAQRKVRKHMGLAVDEDGADSPSPPPLSVSPSSVVPGPSTAVFPAPNRGPSRKRQFDVASLLAPDSGEDTAEEDIDVVSSDQQEQQTTRPWPIFPIVNYYQALLQARPNPQNEPSTNASEDS
ncbi:PREDICTED: forkhead box protein L1-like [Nicrophorus vespilloides]|uniref:Forkhead box protein L1-like n=1 Tax=Nicrophorus vespilloides TaxID=110193 RepID=A0ABM1M9E9_NICVS|nr:PREDICTED: forkhead box protein L1-like [Nicrophorus vespilloides]